MADPKIITSIEILHLDETGYGPEGKHTRREWREECLTNLLAGKAQFEAWQRSWEAQAQSNERVVSFGLNRSGADETHKFDLSHSLDFSGNTFKQKIDARQITFDCNVLFSISFFIEEADFSDVTFSGNAYFSDSTFSANAEFSDSTFSANAEFSDATFSGNAYFSDSTFSANAEFSDATFSDYADFRGSEFLGCADFSCSRFTIKSIIINFDESEFGFGAYFNDSTFSGYADFSDTKFLGNVRFRQTTFDNGTHFAKAHFYKITDFEDASFANIGHFEQATFKSKVPAFRGCKIDATRLEFSDQSHFPYIAYSDGSVDDISFLKRLADHHGQVDQAIEFNAMELRANRLQRLKLLIRKKWYKRVFDGDWWSTRVTSLYECLPDFGRSFTKPLKYYGYLLASTYVLALVVSLVCAPKFCDDSTFQFPIITWADYNECDKNAKLFFTGYTAASEYMLYRSSGFIHLTDKTKQIQDVNRRLFSSPVEPWFMRIWGIVSSLVSTVLFFFIGLGLRNRYRIK